MLIDREAVFAEVKKKMEKAQAHMRHFADTKHNNVQFMVGDLVLVKLKPHRHPLIGGAKVCVVVFVSFWLNACKETLTSLLCLHIYSQILNI